MPDQPRVAECQPPAGGCQALLDLKSELRNDLQCLGDRWNEEHEEARLERKLNAERHEQAMRALGALAGDWAEITKVREAIQKAVDRSFDDRLQAQEERIERLAIVAGGAAGREAGSNAGREAATPSGGRAGRRAALPYSAAGVVLAALITALGAVYASHHPAHAAPPPAASARP